MSRTRTGLVLCLTLLWSLALGHASPARADSPVLTILFNGNPYGNYEPCPS